MPVPGLSWRNRVLGIALLYAIPACALAWALPRMELPAWMGLAAAAPVALVLTDPGQRVALANIAARKLLGDGRKLEGHDFAHIVEAAAPALRNAMAQGDALFALGDGDDDDIIHLSRRSFLLNGRRHELFLLRQLTIELRRQEVRT